MPVEIRPTVASDIAELTDQQLPFRIRGWTGVLDGRVIGIGGLGYMPNGGIIAFVHLSDEARKHKFALHRTAVKFMAEAKRLGIRELMTLADPEICSAENWLIRLGFQPVERDSMKVYRWTP